MGMVIDYGTLRQTIARAPAPAVRTPPGYEKDSVCLLLLERTETAVLAIEKTDSEGYPWRGQVALPGGRIDPADQSPADAALRELREELGIDRSEVEVLGCLGHFQTATSKNDLEVLVGRWMRPSEVHADAREVARVLEIPLSDLTESHCASGFRSQPVSSIGNALVYEVCEAKVWGVTARILHHFLELVLDNETTILRRRPS